MKTPFALAMILAAGTPVLAQEVIVVPLTWTEMVAGTNTPILNPNGQIDPGEGALIELGMYALRNGTNAVGQIVTVNPQGGPTSFTGPIRGIGHFVYDLVGSGADATGTWHLRLISPIFNFAPFLGVIAEGGARVHALNGVQVAHGGAIVDGTNPIPNVWRGVWTPASYTPRTVHFQAEASDAVPIGQQNSVDVEIGIDPSTGYPLYNPKYFASDFSPGIDIPINPQNSLTQSCYPNCDGSTGAAVLNVNDFVCYLTIFGTGSSLANCDGSIRQPLLTANDFMCYVNKFVTTCP